MILGFYKKIESYFQVHRGVRTVYVGYSDYDIDKQEMTNKIRNLIYREISETKN